MSNFTFESVLTSAETSAIIETLDRSKGIKETNHYYNGSVGFYNLDVTNQYLDRIEKLVMPLYDGKLKFENSFTRIYLKDSVLGFHIDRPGLDVTMSLCLRRNTPWPLVVSNKEADSDYSEHNPQPYLQDVNLYDLQEGNAVVCEGRRFPHWRNALACEEDQTNVYVFFHWSKI